jgi:signal transduction histidine kinase
MRLSTKFILLIAGSVIIPLIVMFFIFLRGMGDPAGRFSPIKLLQLRKTISELEVHGGDPEKIRNLFEKISPHFEILIIDQGERIVYSSTKTKSYTDFLRIGENGYHYTFIHLRVPDKDGVVYSTLIGLPMEKVPGSRRPYFMFIVFGSVLLFMILMSVFIIRSINNSISHLEKATRSISEGNLDFRLEARGNDSIASLTRSFDKMRENVLDETASRSRFLMAVSHDLKTPLSSITGYLDAIQDGMAETPEQLEKYLSIIRDKTGVLESRIRQLIDFVKMETGEWERSRENVCLSAFLQEAVTVFGREAEARGYSFEPLIDIDRDVEISMDGDLVFRVLENLVNNAFIYAYPGSVIGLKAVQQDNQITLLIKNRGEDIAKKDIPFIFEPFYRGSKARSEPGFGLGLSVVKSVVSSHGWEIKVNSQGGETSFTVLIPL